jgi:hypothetical protein
MHWDLQLKSAASRTIMATQAKQQHKKMRRLLCEITKNDLPQSILKKK